MASHPANVRDHIELCRKSETPVETPSPPQTHISVPRNFLNGTRSGCHPESTLSPARYAPHLVKHHECTFSRAGEDRAQSVSDDTDSSSVGSILRRLTLSITNLRGDEDVNIVENPVQGAEPQEEARKETQKIVATKHRMSDDEPAGGTTEAVKDEAEPVMDCSPDDYVSILQELQNFNVSQAVDTKMESQIRQQTPTKSSYSEYARALLSMYNSTKLLTMPFSKKASIE